MAGEDSHRFDPIFGFIQAPEFPIGATYVGMGFTKALKSLDQGFLLVLDSFVFHATRTKYVA